MLDKKLQRLTHLARPEDRRCKLFPGGIYGSYGRGARINFRGWYFFIRELYSELKTKKKEVQKSRLVRYTPDIKLLKANNKINSKRKLNKQIRVPKQNSNITYCL